MSDLLAARLSMAFSLGFHIIFAAIGMTMPFLMSIAHYKYLKTRDKNYLNLTKMWMKGVAILFAVGAVSGTVLSFELGLLWPEFMKWAGPIIGMPFSWEGTAFFLEAVALGLFLYGWNRMHPWVHWFTGVMVGVSGFASGIFVVAANAWMNSPQGFQIEGGEIVHVDPLEAMFNPAWLHQSLHMQVAALQAVGLAVAGIHAYLFLKKKSESIHKPAFIIAMTLAAVCSLLQPLVGHFSAQRVAELQPVKLAAMEGHFHTSRQAPLYLGGIPDPEKEEMLGAVAIPGLLSFLAFNDFDAEVKGLNEFPKKDWPPLLIVHLSFQLMVAIGSFLALIAIVYFFFLYKKSFPPWFLKTCVFLSPMGFVAIEAGWVTTEVGRQPWIIYGFMRTSEALTNIPGMSYHFYIFLTLYLFLGAMTAWLLKRLVQHYG
jgi:cytochrome d ubiquinol oxidase subunit I